MEAFSLKGDIDIHGYAQTVDLADVVDVAHHFHNLWKHHYLLDHSLDDLVLNFHCPAAALDFLNDGLTCHRHLTVLNRRAYLHFGMDLAYDFGCDVLSDFVGDLLDLLSDDLYFHRHFPDDFHRFDLLVEIPSHTFLAYGHVDGYLFVVREVDEFGDFEQLWRRDDGVDGYLHQSFLDFMHDFLLQEVDFFGDLHPVVQFHYLFVDNFHELGLVDVFDRFGARDFSDHLRDDGSFDYYLPND